MKKSRSEKSEGIQINETYRNSLPKKGIRGMLDSDSHNLIFVIDPAMKGYVLDA